MGGAHAHGATTGHVHVSALARRTLVGLLVVAAVATVVGLVWLWPDRERADELQGSVAFAGEGVSFVRGEVVEATDATHLAVEVVEGPEEGTTVSIEVPEQVGRSGLTGGDPVELVRSPGAEGQPAGYGFFGVDRDRPLWLLLGLFVVTVLAVARLRGLLALIGLGFSGLVLFWFMLPGLLTGEPAVPVAVVGSTAIMFVVLYSTHGVSLRTSAALLGTLGGVAVTALIAWWAVDATRLAGIGDEAGGLLTSYAPELDLQGLLLAAVIVAGLGVLNDVTITQASAVWELRGAAPDMSRAKLLASAMRIGRDHIASTIYTIIFAYAGTALLVLLVVQLYDRSLLALVSTEELAGEVVRSLASGIGLVLAVPITTAVAALTVGGADRSGARRV